MTLPTTTTLRNLHKSVHVSGVCWETPRPRRFPISHIVEVYFFSVPQLPERVFSCDSKKYLRRWSSGKFFGVLGVCLGVRDRDEFVELYDESIGVLAAECSISNRKSPKAYDIARKVEGGVRFLNFLRDFTGRILGASCIDLLVFHTTLNPGLLQTVCEFTGETQLGTSMSKLSSTCCPGTFRISVRGRPRGSRASLAEAFSLTTFMVDPRLRGTRRPRSKICKLFLMGTVATGSCRPLT